MTRNTRRPVHQDGAQLSPSQSPASRPPSNVVHLARGERPACGARAAGPKFAAPGVLAEVTCLRCQRSAAFGQALAGNGPGQALADASALPTVTADARGQLQAPQVRSGADRREPPQVDPLHPCGKCTCCGEGRCEWCRRHPEDGQAAVQPSGADRREPRPVAILCAACGRGSYAFPAVPARGVDGAVCCDGCCSSVDECKCQPLAGHRASELSGKARPPLVRVGDAGAGAAAADVPSGISEALEHGPTSGQQPSSTGRRVPAFHWHRDLERLLREALEQLPSYLAQEVTPAARQALRGTREALEQLSALFNAHAGPDAMLYEVHAALSCVPSRKDVPEYMRAGLTRTREALVLLRQVLKDAPRHEAASPPPSSLSLTSLRCGACGRALLSDEGTHVHLCSGCRESESACTCARLVGVPDNEAPAPAHHGDGPKSEARRPGPVPNVPALVRPSWPGVPSGLLHQLFFAEMALGRAVDALEHAANDVQELPALPPDVGALAERLAARAGQVNTLRRQTLAEAMRLAPLERAGFLRRPVAAVPVEEAEDAAARSEGCNEQHPGTPCAQEVR